MDDTLDGKRNKRGHWQPFHRILYPPVFVWPARPVGILKWLFGFPGYLFPWNFAYAVIAVLCWAYVTPPLSAMVSPGIGDIAGIFGRNLALVVLFYGFWHVRLYIQKAQGTSFKYNGNWPDRNDKSFLLGGQTAENMFWTLASAVPIWTAYEVATLWAFANHYIPYVDFTEHPIYFIGLMLAIPLFREVHFYLVHRLIHWPPLYRNVHKLHHKNVNPGPWSGLSMHPVEHVLYFSSVLIHWIVPSHPIHAIYNLVHLGLSPAPGHVGFHKVMLGQDSAMDTHCHAHYLHHKYFECNYADGAVPLDKWFGSFHDGSDEAQEAMNTRFMARAAKAAVRMKAR